jgi:hypothetical protein
MLIKEKKKRSLIYYFRHILPKKEDAHDPFDLGLNIVKDNYRRLHPILHPVLSFCLSHWELSIGSQWSKCATRRSDDDIIVTFELCSI